jgi:hypothetical protein
VSVTSQSTLSKTKKKSIEVLRNASSTLARIRNDPIAKKALVMRREKPTLKPGRIECNRPMATAKAPIIMIKSGLVPKLNVPKKNSPTPIRAMIAPTEKPVHVAQNILLLTLRMWAE